jgi:hypothetical protein
MIALNLDEIHTPSNRLLGETLTTEIQAWLATPEGVREAVLGHHVLGLYGHRDYTEEAPLALQCAPSQGEIEALNAITQSAITNGRLFDFGLIPNEVIKKCSLQSGSMYHESALPHPFADPYMLMHSWEGGVAVYVVSPHTDAPNTEFVIAELQPLIVRGAKILMLHDRVLFGKTCDDGTFEGISVPSPTRFMPGADNIGKTPMMAALSHVLDPLMTMLMILNTDGIDHQHVVASPKLQRARAKNNKPPIPPYNKVLSEPYVTAILAGRARQRSDWQGGTHASPRYHIRHAHKRVYKDHTTFIRATLVNATPEARKAFQTRSHYVVKHTDKE